MNTRALVTLLLVAAAAPAQTFLQPGNVIHAFGGSSAGLLDTGLQTLTPVQLLPGTININRLVWDPASPDDVIVSASDSAFYRATITGAGVTRVQLPLPPLGGVKQLSWDQAGDLLVVGEALGSQIWRGDLTAGTLTPLLSWPQLNVTSGRQHLPTGDYYLGTTAGIYKVTGVPTGAPSVTLVAPTASAVTSVAFDPLQPQFLLFTRSQDLYRLNVTTLLVEPLWTGVQAVDMIRAGVGGDLRAIRSRQVFSMQNPAIVPPGGVPPVLLGANTNVGCCNLTDVAVVGETYQPFRLTIDSQPGCGATFAIDNPPAGTATTWMFFSATTTFAVGTGPFLGLVPDGVTLVFMSAFPDAQPGNFLHSLGPPPALTVIPPGVLCFLSGQTWDVVVAAWGPGLQFGGRTNVQRVAWQ